MRRYSFPTATLGLLLCATSTLALPADVGRTADVYTNAIRYFDARAAMPSAWPGPKSRPENFAARVLPAEVETPSTQEVADVAPVVLAKAQESEVQAVAFGVAMDDGLRRAVTVARSSELALATVMNKPDPFAIALGKGLTSAVAQAEAADALAAELPEPPFALAVALDEGLRRAVAEAARAESLIAVGTPPPYAVAAVYDEVSPDGVATDQDSDAMAEAVTPVSFTAALDEGLRRAVAAEIASEASGDLSQTLALSFGADTPLETPVDDPLAGLDFADRFTAIDTIVVAAAASAEQLDGAVGSSRQAVPDDAEIVDVLAEAGLDDDPLETGTLMADMADADANLVIRDGGENGPDTMMMSSDVLFAFGSATLADDALQTLASIGDMAESVPVIEVFGHTDSIGSEPNNLSLGQKRAEAVRDWLLQNTSFTEARIIATGVGEVDPIAPNLLENGDDNPEGRAQNRRVEFAFHEAEHTVEN